MTSLFDEPTRDPLNFNRTPAWRVELLIPELGQPRMILDAGCGDGAIGKVLRQAFPDASLDGAEVNRARRRACIESNAYRRVWDGDWTDMALSYGIGTFSFSPDLIISNPPFGLAALDFLKCALARVRPGGTVAFLLPTHWDHDPTRKQTSLASVSWTRSACPMAAKATRNSQSWEAGRTRVVQRSEAVAAPRQIATRGSCSASLGRGSRAGGCMRYRKQKCQHNLK